MIDCIIPARGGSKGIPKKNIILLNQIPLIGYTIFIALKSKYIDNVYVSTDSEEIASIARDYGAKTPCLRPSYLASDTANDKQVFSHFFEQSRKLNFPLSEDIVHLRPTTPGRDLNKVNEAIKEFLSDNECTSMRSVHESNLHPHKWFNLKNGQLKPIMQNISDIEVTNMPRQSFPKVFIPNGYIDIVRHSTFRCNGKFHGMKIKSFITQKVIDIDNLADLEQAKKDKLICDLSNDIRTNFKKRP